jgi:hypothetical protein
MTANNKGEEICKEIIATYFKVTFQNRQLQQQNFSGVTEKNKSELW